MAFVLEQFVEDCRISLIENDAQGAIREHIAKAVSDPARIIDALGTPELAGLETLYHAEDLTILNIVWAPGMTLHPHNHCMWANIGIYGGEEENTFYQRSPDGLLQQGHKLLNEKEVVPLHQDVIHSVHNPSPKLTAAIHVYGGDFFNAPRSEWTPDTLREQPLDIEHTRAVFAEANEKLKAAKGT
jgi:predicted metal-dependent enzyme (double-stranded beta helix superfamily)